VNQFQLLRSRRFAPLFIVQFLGAFNDNVFRFGLIIFISFSLAESTGIEPGTLVVFSGGIFILPFFLFSALAGQIADKFEKSAIIKRVKFAEIFIMIFAAVAFWMENLTLLFGVLFLMGSQSAFFGPLKYAILPQHLEHRELTGGNGLIQMGTYTAILLGAVVGGMLAAVTEVGTAAVAACIVLLAVCGWLVAQWIPNAAPSEAKLKLEWNLAAATWRLLKLAASNRSTLVLVLTISWFWFMGATFLSLVPTYAKEALHANEQAVTLMNVAFTLGIGIGSLLCERSSRGRIELGLVPFGALGVSIFAADFFLGGNPYPPQVVLTVSTFFTHGPALRAFCDLVLIGGFGAIFIVPLYAALQARVDTAFCARVMAALNITNAAFMVLSAVFTMALLANKITIAEIFGLVALLNLIIMVIITAAFPEFGRRARAIVLQRKN
jgi:predicted MFS family arabinose efflux permease